MVRFASLVAVAIASSNAAALPNDRRPTPALTNITQINFLQDRSVSGPQLGRDFADPSLIWGDGSQVSHNILTCSKHNITNLSESRWKAYSTSSEGKGVPIAVSGDAFSWSPTSEDALPDRGPWVDPNDQAIWAPDVNKNVGTETVT